MQVKERWYTYDAENRLRIVNGELVGNAGEAGTHIRIRADVLAETTPGQIEVSDSYGVSYDAAGDRSPQLVGTRYHPPRTHCLIGYKFHTQVTSTDPPPPSKQLCSFEACNR